MIHAALLRRSTRFFHSANLEDMRNALSDEDQDGPDGGCPGVRHRTPAANAPRSPNRK